MAEEFDVIVIGAGPGGYVAALRAAELGMKTACIEKEARPGGVCLTIGCIPSKALLESTEHFVVAKDRLGEHAIRTENVSIDLAALMERKERIVAGLSENVRKLLERNRVLLVQGSASLRSAQEVEVAGPDGERSLYRAKKAVLLATGSEPVELPFLPYDEKLIVSSTGALAFDAVPERLAIVGGGYIGLELGSVWARLGTRVTVVELLPRIAFTLDEQVGRLLERLLKKQGIEFRVKTKVVRAEKRAGKVGLFLDAGEGREEEAEFDRVLVAVGRKPLVRGLGLEEVGIAQGPGGSILVDENYRTTLPGVYAIGDLIPGPMLAHKASAEGIAAVEGIAGLAGEVDYDCIPAVVYTSPEAASVGKSEQELKQLGVEYKSAVYPFAGTGRAQCLGETAGFVKLLAHARSGRLLGVHIIGPHASELIAECVVALTSRLTARELSRIVHAHPTLSEAIRESASMLGG